MLRKLRSWDRTWIILDHALSSLTQAACIPESQKARGAQDPMVQTWMRINYSGEVAAQALFLGAMCMARSDEHFLSFAAHLRNELTHLILCKEALVRLECPLPPYDAVWACACYMLALLAGARGDAYAWAFVQETEVLVTRHLRSSLRAVAPRDPKSAELILLMLQDERAHADHAGSQACHVRSGFMPLMRPLFSILKGAVS